MTLRDDIRSIEESHKFDGNGSKSGRRRAAMLYLVAADGGEDESHSWNEDGDGMDRIGRHILEQNSQGFVSVTTCKTESEARDAFNSAIMRDYMAHGYQ